MNIRSLFLVAIVSGSLATMAHAGTLRAGAARVSITPTQDEFPYTVGHERSFVGVHDEVYARALVLEDGKTKVVLVSVEAEVIPDAERVVSDVAKAIGVPPANVIVAATHSHSTIIVFYHGEEPNPPQAKEIEHIRLGAVEAAREASSRLQDAHISFARGEAWVNINNGELAELKLRYDPKGPSDKTLDIVRVESEKGETLALAVSYGTHAETMFRSVTKDGGYEVSGDIPGAVSRMLETNPAGAPVALFFAGAEGDQKSLFQSTQPAVGKIPAQDEGVGGWALVDAQAARLTASVLTTIATMQAGVSAVTLKAAANTASCPGQRFLSDRDIGKATIEAQPTVSIPLSIIQINDIAFAAVGADIGSEFGHEIRNSSPAPHTFVISMLAGSVGYVLTDRSYSHPGHVRESPLKPGCAEHAIPDGIAHLLDSISKSTVY